jgi:hypothetical protein
VAGGCQELIKLDPEYNKTRLAKIFVHFSNKTLDGNIACMVKDGNSSFGQTT